MASRLELFDGEIDLEKALVRRPGIEEVSLTPLEVRLLRFLATHAERAVPAEELLIAVWGYRPGVKSRAVTFTVNRLRAKLEVDRKEPKQLLTVRGRGFQWVRPELRPDGLVGRHTELTALRTRLAAEQRVAVVGRAGVGKSALVEAWQTGWFAEVVRCQLEGPGELVPQLASAVGLDPAEFGEDLRERVLQVLEDRGASLWIDGAEWAPDAVIELASQSLRILVVITSRTPLPGIPTLELGPLPVPDAVELFTRAAQVHVPAWQTSASIAAAIVTELGGLPLALELAASSVRWFAPDELLDRLKRDLAVLPTGTDDLLGRAIRWAISLLSPEERRVFAWLSVFYGAVSFREVEAVLGEIAPDPLTALGSLERKGLIEVHDGRVRLAIGVRESARAALQTLGERENAEQVHRRYVLSRSDAPGIVLDELLHLHARDAVAHPIEAQRALRLVLPLLPARLVASDIRDRIERTRSAVDRFDPSLHAYLGWCRWRLGEVDAAEHILREAEQQAQEQDDLVGLAQAWSFRGALLQESGRRDEAVAVFERAVQALRGSRESTALALALNAVAISLTDRGAFAEAKERLFEGLEATEDTASQALLLNTLGNVYLSEDRLDDAARVYLRALRGPTLLETHRAAVIQFNLASVHLAQGRLQEALEGYERAAEVHRRSGRRRSLGLTLASIGRVHLLQDELEDAIEVFRAAVGYLERVEDRVRASWTRAFHVAALLDADQPEEAARSLELLRAHEAATGQPIGDALEAMLATHTAQRRARQGEGSWEDAQRQLQRLEGTENAQLRPMVDRLKQRQPAGAQPPAPGAQGR